jgi:GT2 family glycosyltransferase
MSQKVGIVTVLYNSESVLSDFFASLNKQTYTDFILYVVDNHSPDHSLLLAKSLTETVSFQTVIIENEANFGVAKGNNMGICRALEDGCELILLSNNDVIIEKETLKYLIQGLEEHQASMVVPKIYYAGTNLIWAAGGYFRKWTGLNAHYGDRKMDKGQYQQARKANYSAT